MGKDLQNVFSREYPNFTIISIGTLINGNANTHLLEQKWTWVEFKTMPQYDQTYRRK